MSKKLAEFTKKFTMSIVVGDDIVSRLSLHSIHALKADILRVFWLIFWNSLFYSYIFK